MPKINRNGQAIVLLKNQCQQVWEELKQPHRLIFQICFFTAARIGEVVQLRGEDIFDNHLIHRARNTKTKKTRQVAIAPPLVLLLKVAELPKTGYLFPGRTQGHITTRACDKTLRETLDYLGIRGAATHSFRRSLLTWLHFEKGYSLRTLQKITDHADIGNLARYLDVDQQEADEALPSAWIEPTTMERDTKCRF
jgi:integrase/recombinase XerD